MPKFRNTPMNGGEISQGIRRVLAYAREDLPAIHLVPCDYEKVRRKPSNYGASTKEDGSIVVSFRGRLVPILPAQ
jgi:hypothetical protein